jgi:hypothetical protein
VFSGDATEAVSVLGLRTRGYLREVTLVVADDPGNATEVVFVEDLPMAGLLGRLGFFDNFRVTFDHSTVPPSLTYERIVRG